jgi:hypothetical protein
VILMYEYINRSRRQCEQPSNSVALSAAESAEDVHGEHEACACLAKLRAPDCREASARASAADSPAHKNWHTKPRASDAGSRITPNDNEILDTCLEGKHSIHPAIGGSRRDVRDGFPILARCTSTRCAYAGGYIHD